MNNKISFFGTDFRCQNRAAENSLIQNKTDKPSIKLLKNEQHLSTFTQQKVFNDLFLFNSFRKHEFWVTFLIFFQKKHF